jgi:hypothetical protein
MNHVPVSGNSTGVHHSLESSFMFPGGSVTPNRSGLNLRRPSAKSPGCGMEDKFRIHAFENRPAINVASRHRVLNVLSKARPTLPDGTAISNDHPLLSLPCMQSYLDLFFTYFNVAYPLLHRATFNPSQAEPLFLLSILLMGATYSDKASHTLAICIHDSLRGQVFQHAGFTASPDLWMLQTLLLLESFGKSRAGQKQHDMAHLFHGLLIK